MAADYYIGEPGEEWEVVERWENEGGRLRQNDDGQRRSNRVGRKISSGGRPNLRASRLQNPSPVPIDFLLESGKLSYIS